MKKQSLSCVLVVVAGLATAGGLSPAAASAHGSSGRDGGLTEHRLRAFETSVLGSSHATEHARERARQRRPSFRAALRRTARASRRAGLRAAVDATPEVDGQWDAPFSIPAVGIHAALLSSGKVLWYHRPQTTAGKATVAIWDPATGQSKAVAPPQLDGKAANFFCSGQSFLADGRLLVVGGQIASHTETTADSGLNTLYTFNPANETWTRQPDMAEGRWYPTSVLQGDGRTLIMSGQDSSGRLGAPFNNDIEIFTPSPDPDGVGTVALLGKRAQPGTPPGGGLYPHLFAMPSGDTLVAGPWAVDSWTLDGLGDGLRSWTDVPNPSDHRYGTGMILPSGPAGSTRVKLIGGGMAATTVNETFDETNPGAGWVTTPPLQVARKNHNTVGLPDGSMVTVGGGTDDPSSSSFVQDNLAVELSNPDGTWRRGASQAEGRAYHSTALLLPDGRVISAGDDTNGGYTTDTAEIYSPPYLFKGARPRITSAPAAVGYGQSFTADVAGDVSKAVLIAPGAVTHSVDMSQRTVPLAITSNANGTVTLTAPGRPAIAPPSVYMLFLVNANGVPSVAKFVRLGAETQPQPSKPVDAVPAPVTPVATAPKPVTSAGAASPAVTPVTPVAPGSPPLVDAPGKQTTPGAGTGQATPTAPGSTATPPMRVASLRLERQRLATARRLGAMVYARCQRGGKLTVQLRVAPATARRYKLGSVVVGRTTVTLTGAKSRRVRVRFTKSALSRLRTVRTLRLTVQAVTGGTRTTASSTLK